MNLEIGDRLNGYRVVAIRPGVRPVPEGKMMTWVILGHNPNRYGARYVAAEVSEQSLTHGEWHQGYYFDALKGATEKAQVLAGYSGIPLKPDERESECEGHESLNGANMGESVYCDGSCARGCD